MTLGYIDRIFCRPIHPKLMYVHTTLAFRLRLGFKLLAFAQQFWWVQ